MDYTRLLHSIATTLSDYRAGEVPPMDATHVDRWITQFDTAVRSPMFEELDHVLKQTYFSKVSLERWLQTVTSSATFAGANPRAFWGDATMLRLQTRGQSQADMSSLLENAVKTKWGVVGVRLASSVFLYVDDFIFTGNTALRDLRAWIVGAAPPKVDLRVVVVAAHAGGKYYLQKALKAAALQAGKDVKVSIWSCRTFEDRKRYVNSAEVFRPTRAEGDPDVDAYTQGLVSADRSPVLRSPGAMPKKAFASSKTRDVLEWELLCAGARLRARCANPKPMMRPLGFSVLATLGFGATVVTFRNCPNNVPIALWWGDNGASSDALAWYPLLPRRPTSSTTTWSIAPASFVGVATSHAVASSASSDDDEDDDEWEMPWEMEAKAAVRARLSSLEFDAEASIVRTDGDELESIEQLRANLTAAYDEQWYANVPFDEGEAAFEGDANSAVEEALESISSELSALGWTI